MFSVCSYCRRVIGEKEPYEDKQVSHGICNTCWDFYYPRLFSLNFSDHLDQYASPIILVDKKVRVVGINQAMTLFLGTTREEALGFLGGEALACRYSRLPEGCGKTIHCRTCSIRRTVNETMALNADMLDIPACIDRDHERVHFRISAYHRAEFVKIIVDKVVGTEKLSDITLPPSKKDD
jgi:hypothetical protein